MGDVLIGKFWHLQCKSLGASYPQTMRRLLDDAILEGKKLNPEMRSSVIVHESASYTRSGWNMVLVLEKDYKELLDCWREHHEKWNES